MKNYITKFPHQFKIWIPIHTYIHTYIHTHTHCPHPLAKPYIRRNNMTPSCSFGFYLLPFVSTFFSEKLFVPDWFISLFHYYSSCYIVRVTSFNVPCILSVDLSLEYPSTISLPFRQGLSFALYIVSPSMNAMLLPYYYSKYNY